MVLCGNRYVEWHSIVQTMVCLQQSLEQESLSKYGNFDLFAFKRLQIRRDDHVRSDWDKNLLLDVARLLQELRGFQATNPRDKIYSILSVAVDGGHDILQPNYELPVEEVYRLPATHLIQRDKNLDILGSCAIQRNHNVPS
jgi:hypothetical protein